MRYDLYQALKNWLTGTPADVAVSNFPTIPDIGRPGLPKEIGPTRSLYMPEGMIELDFTYGDTMVTGSPMDIDAATNTIYGGVGTEVHKSTDGWLTTEAIFDLAGAAIGLVRFLPNGAVLATGYDGSVWVTDANQANAAKKYTFTAGATILNMGNSVHKNICLLSSYGTKGANPPRFVILSRDYGQTFEQIYEGPSDETDYHIHDVDFDPWTGVIWVTEGDSGNTRRYVYSPDFGVTWVPVLSNNRDTGVLALHDRVLFLSDSAPAGIRQIRKNAIDRLQAYEDSPIEQVYYVKEQSSPSMGGWLYWRIRQRDAFPYLLVADYYTGGVVTETNKLIASADGITWYVIWESAMQLGDTRGNTGITSMTPPDSNGYCYGRSFWQSIDGGTGKCFRAKLPTWTAI